jgi:hypothetical protein
MSGRAKIKVYEYNFEGKYLQSYDNIQEARKHYYPNDLIASRPMFLKKELGVEYHLTPKDTILFKERVHRDNVRFIIKIHNSEFCNLGVNTGPPVEMVSIKGEVLATFPNAYVAEVIFPDIAHKILRDTKTTKVKRYTNYDYYFRNKVTKR